MLTSQTTCPESRLRNDARPDVATSRGRNLEDAHRHRETQAYKDNLAR